MAVIIRSPSQQRCHVWNRTHGNTQVGTPVILLATKRFSPNGGVANPMASETTMITPKWTGWYPSPAATGARRGVNKSVFGIASMTQPATKRIRRMIPIVTTGSAEKLRSHFTPACGSQDSQDFREHNRERDDWSDQPGDRSALIHDPGKLPHRSCPVPTIPANKQ